MIFVSQIFMTVRELVMELLKSMIVVFVMEVMQIWIVRAFVLEFH